MDFLLLLIVASRESPPLLSPYFLCAHRHVQVDNERVSDFQHYSQGVGGGLHVQEYKWLLPFLLIVECCSDQIGGAADSPSSSAVSAAPRPATQAWWSPPVQRQDGLRATRGMIEALTWPQGRQRHGHVRGWHRRPGHPVCYALFVDPTLITSFGMEPAPSLSSPVWARNLHQGSRVGATCGQVERAPRGRPRNPAVIADNVGDKWATSREWEQTCSVST